MRKVKLFIATSFDGFIAKTDGNIDWLFTDKDYGYSDFYQSIDTILMGNNTYKQILNFGADFPYADKTNYVFSKQPQNHTEFVRFVSGDIVSFVASLKATEGKDIWLVGGGQVNAVLLDRSLIDEMILSIHPIALGEGLPLFAGGSRSHNFQLMSYQAFASGLMQLVYQSKSRL